MVGFWGGGGGLAALFSGLESFEPSGGVVSAVAEDGVVFGEGLRGAHKAVEVFEDEAVVSGGVVGDPEPAFVASEDSGVAARFALFVLVAVDDDVAWAGREVGADESGAGHDGGVGELFGGEPSWEEFAGAEDVVADVNGAIVGAPDIPSSALAVVLGGGLELWVSLEDLVGDLGEKGWPVEV